MDKDERELDGPEEDEGEEVLRCETRGGGEGVGEVGVGGPDGDEHLRDEPSALVRYDRAPEHGYHGSGVVLASVCVRDQEV